MQFDGYFKADEDGVYKFSLSRDDGSVLTIDDAIVIDNDGPTPWVRSSDECGCPTAGTRLTSAINRAVGRMG